MFLQLVGRFVTGLVVAALLIPGASRAESLSPEDTIRQYLEALQKQDFARTYELVSQAMKKDRNSGQVRSKEVWVRESQYLFQFSETKIFDYQVFSGKQEGDKAFVPNILSSQDKFLNQLGAEEYELYTLVKEDGAWKIDQQQVVIETAELKKWFPDQKEPAAAE